MYSINKAAALWQLTFSVIILSIFTACGDPGSIGAGFIEESEFQIDTILVTDLRVDSADAFLGKRVNSALGSFNDPVFGNVNALAFFKPSIVKGNDEPTLGSSASVSLRFQFNNAVTYGNTNSTNGTYNIYQVSANTPWRGNAFRQSQELEYVTTVGGPFNTLIGSFEDSEIDTTGFVEVSLEGSWKNDYISFYNQPDSIRDEKYRAEDFGLIIVPENSEKVRFAQFNSSRLRIIQEQDTLSKIILDWGYDVSRTGELDEPGRIKLPNTFDKYVTFNLENAIADIENTNFVRAELLIKEDTDRLENSLAEGQVRADLPSMRLVRGPSDRKAYIFGFGATFATGVFNEGIYNFDITTLLNSYLFGSTPIEEIYLIANPNSGVLGYTSIYGPDSDAESAPKIIIYGLDSEE